MYLLIAKKLIDCKKSFVVIFNSSRSNMIMSGFHLERSATWSSFDIYCSKRGFHARVKRVLSCNNRQQSATIGNNWQQSARYKILRLSAHIPPVNDSPFLPKEEYVRLQRTECNVWLTKAVTRQQEVIRNCTYMICQSPGHCLGRATPVYCLISRLVVCRPQKPCLSIVCFRRVQECCPYVLLRVFHPVRQSVC